MPTTQIIDRDSIADVGCTAQTSIASLHAVAGLDMARWVTSRLARRRLDCAADVTQNVWLRALQLASLGEVRCCNRAWLFTIAKHVLREHYRAVTRNACQPLRYDAVAVQTDPVTLLSRQEELQAVRRGFGRFGDSERELMIESLCRGQLRRSASSEMRPAASLLKRAQRLLLRLRLLVHSTK